MRRIIASVVVSVLLGGFTVAVAQLPPEIMVDSYLLRAEQAVRDGDLARARAAINKILALQKEHELDLPDEFHFRYAKAADAAELPEPALEAIVKYLAAAGRDGQHYVEALELMNKAQAEIEDRQAAASGQTATTQAAIDRSTSSSQDGVAGVSCAEWNTQAYFETATVEDVTACLDAGADPAATNDAGVTPLHWAAWSNESPAVIQALLVAGANLEARNDNGGTPLRNAAWNNENLAVLEALLAAGADLEARDEDGGTPLVYAALDNENPAVIETLIAAGADLKDQTNDGRTLLHLAAQNNGNPAVLESLLAAGADLETIDDSGRPPLHRAAVSNENPAVIEFLLAAGADVNARVDGDGDTVLTQAVLNNGNPAVIETLIAAGAEARTNNGRTLLHLAAGYNESLAVVEALLAEGAEVNARDEYGNTPLHTAAGNENPAVIEALLAAGAAIDARTSVIGFTPLHLAARANRHRAVVEALLAADARIDARAEDGSTPLHQAAEYNESLAVVEALLAAGANTEARDEDGNTPLHVASEYVNEFVSGDEDPHAGAAIEALLAAGADAAARNAAGKTPWDLAQENEALKGSDAYWRLNDARFNAPGPDARRAPAGGHPTAAVPGGATVGAPAGTVSDGATGVQCEIPGYPSPPGGAANVGLSWCPASVGIQVRALALQAAGAQCAIATGSSSTPEQINARRQEINAACDRLAALDVSNCQCPAGLRP